MTHTPATFLIMAINELEQHQNIIQSILTDTEDPVPSEQTNTFENILAHIEREIAERREMLATEVLEGNYP